MYCLLNKNQLERGHWRGGGDDTLNKEQKTSNIYIYSPLSSLNALYLVKNQLDLAVFFPPLSSCSLTLLLFNSTLTSIYIVSHRSCSFWGKKWPTKKSVFSRVCTTSISFSATRPSLTLPPTSCSVIFQ